MSERCMDVLQLLNEPFMGARDFQITPKGLKMVQNGVKRGCKAAAGVMV